MGTKISTTIIGTGVIPAIVSVGDGSTIYVFITSSDHYSLLIFKSINSGTSWSALSSVSSVTIHGETQFIDGIDAALDSAGYIHVVCAPYNDATRDYAYNKLDTSNDTWGTWEQAAAYSNVTYGYNGVSIAIDSNNKPHILYLDAVSSMGSTYARVKYTNKVGASWLTPETVDAEATSSHTYPSIAIGPADVINAWYRDSTGNYGRYRARTTSWGTAGSYSGKYPWSVHSNIVTSGSAVYRVGADASYVLNENGVQINTSSGSVYAREASASIGNSQKWIVFFGSGTTTIQYISCPTSGSTWTDPVVQESGTFYNLGVEWAFQNEKQPSTAIRLAYTHRDVDSNYYVYYSAIDTRSFAKGSQSAYIKGVMGARTVPRWWTCDGVTNSDTIFAYQPKYAKDFDSSKINLANPGTYNAYAGTNPGWSYADGWLFTQTSLQFLRTGYTPSSHNLTVIAKIKDDLGRTYTVLFGAQTGTSSDYTFHIWPHYSSSSYFRNNGYYSIARCGDGVYSIAGTGAFFNGSKLGTLTSSTANNWAEFLIGKLYPTATSSDYFMDGSIEAFVLYNKILTDTQVATITQQMNNITSSPGEGPSQAAYINGIGYVNSIQHAYLNSGTYSSGSMHAYLKGVYDVLLPDGDITKVGAWQDELARTDNIFQSIDEWPTPDDSDYILESPPINNDYYECSLANPIGVISAGTMSVKWRGRNNTSGSIVARVQLRQGSSTVIASRDQVLPTNPTTYAFDLTSGERANITDPTDLRLRFIVVR